MAFATSSCPIRFWVLGVVSSMAAISGETLSSRCTPGMPTEGGSPAAVSSGFRPNNAISVSSCLLIAPVEVVPVVLLVLP